MQDLLDQLERDCIQKISKKACSKLPALKNSALIKEVAEHSLASQMGIEAGDLLIEINGRPAVDIDLWQWSLQSCSHSYTIYQTATKHTLKIFTNGIPLGIDTEKSSQAIVHQHLSGYGDFEDLHQLWQRYEWQGLWDIHQYRLRQTGTIQKWLAKLMGKSTTTNAIDCLFQAVAQYEAGHIEEGMEGIQQFENEHAHRWQVNYQAIAMYYRAKEKLRLQDPSGALDTFIESYKYWQSDLAKQEILALGGQIEQETTPWEHAPFPFEYKLPKLHTKESVSLTESLQTISYPEVLILCFLGQYRSNKPYDDFMQHYQVLNQYFPNVVSQMHVITATEEDGNWQEHEHMALSKALPIELLYDQNNQLAHSLSINTSPCIFVLHPSGKVLMQKLLSTQIDFWTLLTRVSEAQTTQQQDST